MIQSWMFFNSVSELLRMSVWELWVNWESDMFYCLFYRSCFCLLSSLIVIYSFHCFFHLLNFSIAKLFGSSFSYFQQLCFHIHISFYKPSCFISFLVFMSKSLFWFYYCRSFQYGLCWFGVRRYRNGRDYFACSFSMFIVNI